MPDRPTIGTEEQIDEAIECAKSTIIEGKQFLTDHPLYGDLLPFTSERYRALVIEIAGKWTRREYKLYDAHDEMWRLAECVKHVHNIGLENIDGMVDFVVEFAFSCGLLLGHNRALYPAKVLADQLNRTAEEKRKADLEKANAGKRRQGDRVREAALADILAHRNTSQTDCAIRVATLTNHRQRSVERAIQHMFEWRALPGGAREKRPKAEYLTAPA